MGEVGGRGEGVGGDGGGGRVWRVCKQIYSLRTTYGRVPHSHAPSLCTLPTAQTPHLWHLHTLTCTRKYSIPRGTMTTAKMGVAITITMMVLRTFKSVQMNIRMERGTTSSIK